LLSFTSNYREYEVIQNSIIDKIEPIFTENDMCAYKDRAVFYIKKRLVKDYEELSILNKIRFGKKFYRLLCKD